MIHLLVKYGANINVRDEDGQTPLLYGRIFNRSLICNLYSIAAAHASHIPTMKLLLQLGADPTIADNDGTLPSSVAQTDEEKEVWQQYRK